MSTEATAPPPADDIPPPSPEEVKAYLEANPGQPHVDSDGKTVAVNLNASDLQTLRSKEAAAAAPGERRELREDPFLADADFKVWTRNYNDFGKVEVTLFERDLYFKAALNDQPITFDVDVPMKVSPERTLTCRMVVRSLNNFETDVIYRAAQQEQLAAAGMLNAEQLGRMMQQFCVILHVLSFEGQPMDFRLSFPGPGFPDIDTAAQLVRNYYDQHYRSMHPARYALLITGVRLFERKLKICSEALLNQNF